jgi:hypothetical protein
MLGRLFSKLLWAPHQGSADAIFGMVDDHDNGGTAAGFAESNPDLQFGEIWDRTFCLPFIVRYLKAVLLYLCRLHVAALDQFCVRVLFLALSNSFFNSVFAYAYICLFPAPALI